MIAFTFATTFVLAWTLTAMGADEAPASTLFTNVSVFDGKAERLAEGMNVLVVGNLIESVSAEAIEAPGATKIDGGGRTLMPGLIDLHSHLLARTETGV